ncbi:MAG: NAD-dependent epimerase/dehydratase family protein [Saprospiraceae bacterium]|nr:NAD-dependent epimerase/dehydratase family protein [Saprospiraceae bacterium]
MKNQIHTVLGASGASGRAVIKELQTKNYTIRAVERNSKTKDVAGVAADLLKADDAINAIKGSAYVYLCVGLPYQAKIWQRDWPLLIQNVIKACEQTNAVLIFLDNVYMYERPLAVPFSENQPQNPTTIKGKARKQTADLLLNAIANKKIQGVIGRSADFYGEYTTNSMFYASFLENLLKGKSGQYLSKNNVLHTYAYVGDNAKALVALATDPTTYGQVWHLPVGKPISPNEINRLMNASLGVNYELKFVPTLMRKLLGLFIKPIAEVEEMLYQFETDYIMDCQKFMTHFPNFELTPYEVGISKMIQSFQNEK